MIYGLHPMRDTGTTSLKPVMTLKSTVATFRKLKVGETVSYSGTWTARRESIIAVVPIGYADGYHRLLSGRSKVLFAGHKVPVVGSVCMDYLMVDVTDVIKDQDPQKFQDQEVILFGSDKFGNYISPDELANFAETVMWEILTSVGERVPRVYVGDGRSFILNEVGAKQ
jgi:alanine racemase